LPANGAFPHRIHEKIARSLRQHRELILNHFRAQKALSNGVVEGLNKKKGQIAETICPNQTDSTKL
jgi:hypothetical protein